jgi:hypothetical protein
MVESVPAPFWFVEFFKVVGFVLHLVPQGIWFAGLPILILCALYNGKHSRYFSIRLSKQLPVMMALGINFGIVPLLFLQTTYYKSFYTATVLTAWYWIAVIPILLVGYYSLYIAAYSGSHSGINGQGRRILFSILAAVCLTCIGALIVNGLSLMVRSDLWTDFAAKTSFHGAVLGTANNMSDPAFLMRLLTMFGLALMTAGTWIAFDGHYLVRKNSEGVPENYRQWSATLAVLVTLSGCAVLTYTECAVKSSGHAILTTAYPYFGFVVLGAYAVFLLFLLAKTVSPVFVAAAALLQFLTLAGFGIIRQIGQNNGIKPLVDVANLPAAVQWDTLIAFVVLFLLGTGVIVWMTVQCIKCSRNPAQECSL